MIVGDDFSEDPVKEEEKFYELKLNLTNLTKVVDTFFTNLSEFFENTSHVECEQKSLYDPKAKADSELNVGIVANMGQPVIAAPRTAPHAPFVTAEIRNHPAPPQRTYGFPNYRAPGPRR